MNNQFETELSVRDYECDLQGVVNNAVYLNYLEHARHEMLRLSGIDFAKLHADGIDPVVVRVELDYRRPLRSQDRFVIRSSATRMGRMRMVFRQDVYRISDDELMVSGKVIAAILQNGRPVIPDRVIEGFEALLTTDA